MLSLFDTVAGADGRASRREFLRVGALGLGGLSLGGLTLPGLLAAKAQAAAAAPTPSSRGFVRDKSVVLLVLQGGPPCMETFDPKPDAPDNVRSATGEIRTALPGVLFGGTFPKLAKLANRLAVVRSFGAGKGGLSHEAGYTALLTAGRPENAPMGAVYARAAGALNTATGVPNNTILLPEAIDPKLKLGNPSGAFTLRQTLTYFAHAGAMGAGCEAFNPAGGGTLLENLALRLPRERFDDRRALLQRLDGLRRRFDAGGELDGASAFQQQAADVLLRGIGQAFDLSREDARTVERYDTSHLINLRDIHKGGKLYRPNFSRTTNLLGRQMLLARRLCEAGCGFVTVVDSCWDFHDDGNNPPAAIGMPVLGPQLDHAVAAFLEDVEARGLSDKILLVITAEMGRTPKKSGGKSGGGTGHWGELVPLVLAGGGLKTGQVIGRSDAKGAFPATERYGPENLMATVLQTVFDVNEVRVADGLPKGVVSAVADAKPIAELF
jgi:hypothetical protein